MGKPLIIQESDDKRIKFLKKAFGLHRKIDVIRAGLNLLEQEAEYIKRVKQWKHAVQLVVKSSQVINKEFQAHSGMKSKGRVGKA